MKRTQIYLLESQKEELDKLSKNSGKALAEVIREAVDLYIVESKKTKKSNILETQGLWKDRQDMDSVKYVETLRKDLDSRLED